MPCTTQPTLTEVQKSAQNRALARLQRALAAGTVTVVVGRNGAIAFKGWNDREGISDLCAYRALSNTPELRRATLRAEVFAGTKVNPQALASGLHSHDGGKTWGRH